VAGNKLETGWLGGTSCCARKSGLDHKKGGNRQRKRDKRALRRNEEPLNEKKGQESRHLWDYGGGGRGRRGRHSLGGRGLGNKDSPQTPIE